LGLVIFKNRKYLFFGQTHFQDKPEENEFPREKRKDSICQYKYRKMSGDDVGVAVTFIGLSQTILLMICVNIFTSGGKKLTEVDLGNTMSMIFACVIATIFGLSYILYKYCHRRSSSDENGVKMSTVESYDNRKQQETINKEIESVKTLVMDHLRSMNIDEFKVYVSNEIKTINKEINEKHDLIVARLTGLEDTSSVSESSSTDQPCGNPDCYACRHKHGNMDSDSDSDSDSSSYERPHKKRSIKGAASSSSHHNDVMVLDQEFLSSLIVTPIIFSDYAAASITTTDLVSTKVTEVTENTSVAVEERLTSGICDEDKSITHVQMITKDLPIQTVAEDPPSQITEDPPSQITEDPPSQITEDPPSQITEDPPIQTVAEDPSVQITAEGVGNF
jgi:hypothetical protein